MITLIFIIILTLTAFFFGNFIRKQSLWLYLGSILLSIVAFIFKDIRVAKPIVQGFLGFSLFYLVMIAGSLPKKRTLRKKLYSVRREYSIIGFIMITPHALKYLIETIQGQIDIPFFGIVAFVLMIPLFITSFPSIRKKMSFKTWKYVQMPAYLIYALLLVHLIINYSEKINLILFIILFTFYLVTKIIFEIKEYQTKKKRRVKANKQNAVQETI